MSAATQAQKGTMQEQERQRLRLRMVPERRIRGILSIRTAVAMSTDG